MASRPRASTLLLAGTLVAGCSRSLPDIPSDSPLSPEAAPAQPADVGVALRSDPPLPGESAAGWEGLGEAEPDAGHHHHHGHGMPSQPKPEPKPEPSEQREGAEHDH